MQDGTSDDDSADGRAAPARWQRLRPVVMPLVYVAFTMLVFWQVWTPIDGARRFWRFDPRFEYWGDLVFQVDSLRDHTLALWNPFDRGGFPIYGDPQPGLFYPGNWPLMLWGMIGGAGYGLIAIKILAHWAFGGIGMHLVLRRFGAREPACYAGGMLLAFTSPRMRYGGSALNWSAAWIPWVLLACVHFADKPTPRRAILLGTTFSMVLLTGAPAVVLYTLLICGPFLLWRMRGQLLNNWRTLAIAAGVTLLWLAPLMASNMEQLPESVRQQRDLNFIAHSAYSPAHLVGLIIPRISGQNVYFGILALLGVGAALVSHRRGLAALMISIAAAGVLLAFGTHAGVLPASASAIPLFGFFRQAHRYMYITAVALPIVAALGLSYAANVEDNQRRRALARWLTIAGALTTFAVGFTLLISVVISDKVASGKNDALALGLVSAGLATLLIRGMIVSTKRWRTGFAWAATVVIALDVWTANSGTVSRGWTPPPKPKHDAELGRLQGVDRDWRVYDWGYLDFRPGTRLHIRDFGGYEDDPLGLSRYKLLRDAAKRDLRLLGHANVRYFLNTGKRNPKLMPKPRDGFEKLARGIWQLPERAPAVYYVPRAQSASSAKNALTKLRGFKPGANAVIEGAPPTTSPEPASVTTGRIVILEPNRLIAEIETPGPGMVVISEAYFSPWSATVDGTDVDIQPANVMFRAVPVSSAGVHRIEMQLKPMRFWGLLPLYLAALALFCWAVIASIRERRGGQRHAAEPGHLPGPSRRQTSTPPTSDLPTAAEST